MGQLRSYKSRVKPPRPFQWPRRENYVPRQVAIRKHKELQTTELVNSVKILKVSDLGNAATSKTRMKYRD
jgi:hypothetical protein